jgi:hypothetical protein
MKKNFAFRFVTFYSITSIFFQSLLPFFSAIPRPVSAQDVTPTVAVTETPTNTPEPTITQAQEPIVTPTVEPAVTPEPTIPVKTSITSTESPAPTVSIEPTVEPTPLRQDSVGQAGEILERISTSITPTAAPEENKNSDKNNEQQGPSATPAPSATATVTPTAAPATPDETVQAEVVKLDGSYADPNLVPSTWTDKADYAPTEKVVVSGKNFIAGQTYTIVISSNDDPAVTHTGTFAAQNDGTFTYEYTLDGNYRPNYTVEIKDNNGQVVAGTTFLDSRWVTSAKINGGSSTTVAMGSSVSAEVQVATWNGLLDSNDNWRSTSYTIEGFSPVCINHPNHNGTGIYTETFSFSAPNTIGTYNITFKAYSDNTCSTSGLISIPLTLNNAIITTDNVPPVITLVGDNPQIIEAGGSYIELGAVVTDNIDAGLHTSIDVSDVNTSSVGTYKVRYNAVDLSGNPAVQVLRTVQVVDTMAPAAPTLIAPADGSSVKNTAALLNWSDVTDISGPVTYQYKSAWIGGSYGPVSTGSVSQIDASGSVERTYTWQVRACDSQSNCSGWSGPWTVTIDSTPPGKPNLISPANNSYHTSSTLTNSWNTVSDAVLYIYESYNDAGATDLRWHQEITAPSTSKTAVGVADAIFWWRVKAVDAAGNVSDWSDLWKITVDSNKPGTPIISTPLDGQYFKTSPILNQWTPISDFSGIKQYWVEYIYSDGHTFSGGPYRYTTTNSRYHSPAPTEQGGVTIRVRAEDNAGNLGEWSNAVHYTFDSIAPIITISNPNTSAAHSKTITAITSEGTLTMAETTGTICNSSLTFVSYTDKTYTLESDNGIKICYRAEDLAGNVSYLLSSAITGIDNTGPYVQITAPIISNTNSNVAIRGTVTDANPHHYWLVVQNSAGTTIAGPGTVNRNTSFTDELLYTWNISSVPDGTYKIRLEARDAADNKDAASSTFKLITIDRQSPTVDLVFPTPGPSATSFKAVFNEQVSKTDAENPANYFLHNWPGAGGSGDLVGDASVTYDEITRTATVNFIHAGWYISPEQEWGVQNIHDLAGNIQLVNSYTEYSTPLVAPVTTVSGIDAFWHSSATITFNCSDVNGSGCKNTYYTTDGSTPTTSSSSGNSVLLNTNGEYTISYFSTDKAGNVEDVHVKSQVVRIDTTKPESVIISPDNTGSNSIVYSNSWDGFIGGSATDSASGIDHVELSIKNSEGYYWNGTDWNSNTEVFVTANGTTDWTYQLPEPIEGTYIIYSHAVDAAGNRENTYTLTVILDKTIPEVAISLNPTVADAANGWYKTQPEITLTATDTNFDKIEYQWDLETGVWTLYTSPFKPGNEGAHVLYYRAHDLANNYSETGIKNIKWNKTDLKEGPLEVNVSPNPTSETTSKVTWKAATSETIGIDKYEVQWHLKNGDKTYTVTVGSDVREYTVDKLTEGIWEVKVTAFDASGNNKSAPVDLTVDRTGPTAPTLSIFGTAVGSVSLSWNKIEEANNYIIWYGTSPGIYQYGAKVGDTQNYTVQGLGAGSYYFIVRAVDPSGNQSGNSNEVSTGAIAGTPGVAPGQPASGFAEQVLGTNTLTPTPVPTGAVLGVVEEKVKNNNWWWLLLLLIPPSAWFGYKKWKKSKENLL